MREKKRRIHAEQKKRKKPQNDNNEFYFVGVTGKWGDFASLLKTLSSTLLKYMLF